MFDPSVMRRVKRLQCRTHFFITYFSNMDFQEQLNNMPVLVKNTLQKNNALTHHIPKLLTILGTLMSPNASIPQDK